MHYQTWLLWACLQPPHFTSLSSFSIFRACWTMGPRTAYSTRLTLGFMLSKVSTLPLHGTPFAACRDMFVVMSHRDTGLDIWNIKEDQKHQEWTTATMHEQTKCISCYQLFNRSRFQACLHFLSCSSELQQIVGVSQCSYCHPMTTPLLFSARDWLDFPHWLRLRASSVPNDAFKCCRKKCFSLKGPLNHSTESVPFACCNFFKLIYFSALYLITHLFNYSTCVMFNLRLFYKKIL